MPITVAPHPAEEADEEALPQPVDELGEDVLAEVVRAEPELRRRGVGRATKYPSTSCWCWTKNGPMSAMSTMITTKLSPMSSLVLRSAK